MIVINEGNKHKKKHLIKEILMCVVCPFESHGQTKNFIGSDRNLNNTSHTLDVLFGCVMC